MEEETNEMRTLALTPTWSVATVLTIFVAVSLIVERSIHRLCNWLRETKQKPLLATVEKMKEELMLLGFISLLLTATSSIISTTCIPSKFYGGHLATCTRPEFGEGDKHNSSEGRKLEMLSGYEPFVSYQVLERLHRFIFVMAITHICYSCLTVLLAIVKIHSWRAWEDIMDCHDPFTGTALDRKTCFFRQFGPSVVHTDYLTLRKGFILNHNLPLNYDFHSYMIRSMEEEFHRIVGVSVPLWGFVVAFMLLNVEGSNLYFWISVVPITVSAGSFEFKFYQSPVFCKWNFPRQKQKLVLLVGAKLQHVIAILTLETAGLTEHSEVGKLKPRDDLFWFKKPELFLPLIHFILFQWQFGYKSCFIRSHFLVYIRLVLGFAGQFLCSYSTLPLYALVTQMGTKYKAALIPQIIRETLLGLGKAARRKTKDGIFTDDPTMHTDTRTVMVEEENHHLLDIPENDAVPATQIEFQPASFIPASPTTVANETSCRAATRFLRPSASVPSSERSYFHVEDMPRSSSMPIRHCFLDHMWYLPISDEAGKLKPQDDLFWFKKPELLLPLIHFILFQWQFGYRSCFIRSHFLVYIRLVLGFAGQFLCSYSTLPLYALVTQMGTNCNPALFSQRIRETIIWWGKEARRKTRDGIFTDTRTVMFEEENHLLLDIPENDAIPDTKIELQPASFIPASPTTVANETSRRLATPFLRSSASAPSSERSYFHVEDMPRSSSMPIRK
uniref:MLO-like protein n=1 Tax=Salix viminalis TaxID=40686 RepID=A0A6N2NK49_SALVM